VMNSILGTATSVLGKLTPVFAGAAKTIAGPFKQFGDTLLKAFGSPAVKTSIGAVATAFGKLLTALTPQLGGDIAQVADGISRIARSVADHPQAFADFVQGFFKLAGIALDGISALANFGGYLQQHFWPAMHETAVIFDGVRHDIAHIWDQIYENSIGTVIRFGHDVERDFNDFRHRTAVVFDGMRGDIAHYWDMTWNNTVGRVQRGVSDVVHWVGTLQGRAAGIFKGAGSWLYNAGKDVLQGFWNGLTSIWGGVMKFINSIAGWISAHKGPLSLDKNLLYQHGRAIMSGFENGLKSKWGNVQSLVSGVAGAASAAASGAAGVVQAAMQRAAAARGWTGAQWNALNAVEMREAGYNLQARNPSSGAYGLAQFINGPSEYATYGGNLSMSGQITAMLNYIAQRYRTPGAAWAHEQAFNWYDTGYGILPPGLSLSYNGTGRPEPLMPARGDHSGAATARSGGNEYHIHIHADASVDGGVIGGKIVERIRQYEKRSGHGWRK
jgi:hypothetical protein